MFTDRFARGLAASRRPATVPRAARLRVRAVGRAARTVCTTIAFVSCGWASGPAAAATPPADTPAVRADPATLTAADRAAIETTIRRQLDAFGRDDAEGAFGYATPDIRQQFRSSDNFLRMVQEQYDAVYRAAGVTFGRLARVDGRWVQTVQLVDGEGRVWRALFTMRRQADRAWKVGGCELVQTSALAT